MENLVWMVDRHLSPFTTRESAMAQEVSDYASQLFVAYYMGGQPIYEDSVAMYIREGSRKAILDFFRDRGFRVLTQNNYLALLGSDTALYSLRFGDFAINLDSWSVAVAPCCFLMTEFRSLFEAAPPLKMDSDVDDSAYMLINTPDGLTVRDIGSAGREVQRGNYHPSTLSQIDHLIEELSSCDPTGRLSLLIGPPGTGKTFAIRGVMSRAIACTFVYLPAQMLHALIGPNIIPTLLSLRDEESSIVLVVEDADDLLARRTKERVVDLSTLLNLTSGVVGELLDVRVIATTNLGAPDVDPALLRDGRICGEPIIFEPLGTEQAQEVYASLGGEGQYTGDGILASIYRAAR